MYVYYNANPTGKATGDCVIRAISAVTGLSWRDIHWDLAILSNEMYQMMNFMNQFNQFRSTLTGNPEQMVQQLRQSGQMSDEQFNQFSQMANQIMPFMRR